MDVPAWRLDIDDSTGALHQREAFVAYLKACRAVGDYAAAEIIFGEIVANAMIHAPGPIAVTVEWLDGHALLHVFDAGLPLDAARVSGVADPFDEHGRGLAIVKGLSPELTVDNGYSSGKTVSAELPVRLGA